MPLPLEPAITSDSVIDRFFAKFKDGPNCWEWAASTSTNGYGQFRYEGTMHRAHRIAYRIYSGAIPAGYCVLHSCDNPTCVNPSHLVLGTVQDNVDDRIAKGRSLANALKGEINHNSKLTDHEVWQIRDLAKGGRFTQRELGKLYNVSGNTVNQITRFKAWASSVNPYLEPSHATN